MSEGAKSKRTYILGKRKAIILETINFILFLHLISSYIYVWDKCLLYIFHQTQIEKSDNKTLQTENERFRCENIAMKEAMKKIICPQCDFERASNLENLKEENQRLTDEVNLLFILFIFFPWKTLLICNWDKFSIHYFHEEK